MMNNKNFKNSSLSALVLNPNYITGFIDAEGSFGIYLRKTTGSKYGFEVQAIFQICLHIKDIAILELIKSYFGGVGNNLKQGKNSVQYRVASLQDLTNVIIPHFDKYPLITQKRADFELFKMIIEIMNRKEHLTIEGIQKIIAIKASLNWGLSDELKAAFSNIIPIQRPLVVDQVIKDPNWISGFVTGEGGSAFFYRY